MFYGLSKHSIITILTNLGYKLGKPGTNHREESVLWFGLLTDNTSQKQKYLSLYYFCVLQM